MTEFVKESYAKINLALDVLKKRTDGYHEINTIMQQINLKDRLIFKEIKEGIIIESNNKDVPLDSSNLVFKAWDKLRNITGINKGVHIFIEKNIPIAAGLAGGSGNCAATLDALNLMWELGLSKEELMGIGKEIGADVPFCLIGGTAHARGIGEKLTKLKSFCKKNILIANPGIQISAGYAYSKLNLDNKKQIDVDNIIDHMDKNNLVQVGKSLENFMEEPILKEYPIIKEIKDVMINNGALGSLMSGSGSTVFGLFDDISKMESAKQNLLKFVDKVFICETV